MYFSKFTGAALAALSVAACGNNPAPNQLGSASSSASVGTIAPTPSATTASTTASTTATSKPTGSVSAKKAPAPYAGPVASLTGLITSSGDEPPLTYFAYIKGCEAAAGVYGKLFRIGQDGGLADAVVAVTHYKGFVPPKKNTVKITIKNYA